MLELRICVDITVKCQKCNAELSADFDERRSVLAVEPCERCLDEAHGQGRAEAQEELFEQQEAVEAAEES